MSKGDKDVGTADAASGANKGPEAGTLPKTVLTPQSKSKDGRLFVSGVTQFSISTTGQNNGNGQIEYRVDSNDWSIYREPFVIPDEGEHRIEYRGVDNVGNIEVVRTAQVTVDNTPPITAVSANNQTPDSSDTIIINRPVIFTLDPYDILSGIKSTEYRIDHGKWLPYSPFRVDGNAPHLISVRSTDNVGNQEQAKTIAIKIDRTAPVSVITVGEPRLKSADGSDVVSEATFFTISAKDAQSTVEKTEYRLDNSEWQRYQPFTIQKQGRHRIEFRSSDRPGNVEFPHHIDVAVVTTPPTTTISVNKKPYESGAFISSTLPFSVTAGVRDAGAGIKTTEYRINGGNWAPFKPFTVSAEGEHVVEVRSTDRLGNIEPTRFVKLLIDRSSPQTDLIIGEPKRIDKGIVYITDKTGIALSASDPLSGVSKSEYVIEGTGEQHGSEPFNILTGGEYKIHYWSIDRLGNREKEHVTTVSVEVPKPAAREFLATVNKTANLSASETDKTPKSDSELHISANSPESQVRKEQPVDKAVPVELMNDPLFNKAPRDTFDPEQGKKLFSTGGINAAIIAIIMLIL